MSRSWPRCIESRLLLVGWVACALAGCTHEALPTYRLTDAESTLRLLAQHAPAARVRTISAQGQVELARADGQSIRLDTALAAEPPERVRLRAWKFGQAALDLTLTSEGLWIMQPRQSGESPASQPAGLRPEQFRRMWQLLDGGLFSDPQARSRLEGEEIIITRQEPDGMSIVCRADRATLTPRRYEILDASGQKRFTLTLDKYALFGPERIAWPRRIVALSSDGRITVTVREAQFNQPLAAQAFVPPRRARKFAG
jgi:hypothetical protein